MQTHLPLRGLAHSLIALAITAPLHAAELRLSLPLGRVAYQTNESIELAVVRSDKQPLPAGSLRLHLSGSDGSAADLSIPVGAVPLAGADARTTEHLRLNGWLLRPGNYGIEVTCDGATAKTNIEVYSHLRRSTFKIIDWGSRAKGAEQTLLGENSLGINLNYWAYGGFDADAMIRGHVDFMRNCTMSGGHQMDLRQECDWSDAYVVIGGEARVVREAFSARRYPNALGVHFYDEPGLTWWKHKDTGVMVPFNLPSADRSYSAAFNRPAPQYNQVKPDDAAAIEEWYFMNRWKESFLDAAWKYSASGVSQVRPDLLSVTQTVYGFSAYADGYYFNADRSLPVISGHGGYSDWGPLLFNPHWTFVMGRARNLAKPNWYLPSWANNMPSNQYRAEQFMSFMTNLQGLAKPPDATIHNPSSIPAMADGIVESHKLAARLGTIFTTMPVTRPPVAMLWSLSHNLAAEVRDMQNPATINKSAYEGGGHNRDKTLQLYLAAQMAHLPIMPVVEEDILDGTVAAHHKVLILPGIDDLDAKVSDTLENWIAAGGIVLVSDDSRYHARGAQRLGAALSSDAAAHLAKLHKDNNKEGIARTENFNYYLKASAPVARVLRERLAAFGVLPAMDADSTSIFTNREALGDIEYLFALNITWNEAEGKTNSLKAATGRLTIPDDGRPVYDAVRPGIATEFKSAGKTLAADVRFGPGQMRAFARTARPIGGIQLQSASVQRDYTLREAPVRLDFSAALLDTSHRILAGSVPVFLRITAPLGIVRFEGYRATDRGVLRFSMPLAANDPAGKWTISASEMLADTKDTITFDYAPPPVCGALAGAVERAVSFANERDNLFRFFRTHQDLTLIAGSSAFDQPAAQRLADIVKPWGVRCRIVAAADANKPRRITDEEARTWVGLEFGRVKPADARPDRTGFAVDGPSILLGNPEDNAIIKFIADQRFLPYKVDKLDFPGRGRGMLAWQRDAVSYGAESITLIAYDEKGMSEAVGTLYESCAALDPLMPLLPPVLSTVTPATSAHPTPEPQIAWRTVLPDIAAALHVEGTVLKADTLDGSTFTLNAAGAITARADIADAKALTRIAPKPVKLAPPIGPKLLGDRIVKLVQNHPAHVAVGYWGGTLQMFATDGTLESQCLLDDDISAMTWLGDVLVVAKSGGSVIGIKAERNKP
ncbi:MAG: hypothetical protein ABSH20_09460 [Tepidisphaeraceae bacterium]